MAWAGGRGSDARVHIRQVRSVYLLCPHNTCCLSTFICFLFCSAIYFTAPFLFYFTKYSPISVGHNQDPGSQSRLFLPQTHGTCKLFFSREHISPFFPRRLIELRLAMLQGAPLYFEFCKYRLPIGQAFDALLPSMNVSRVYHNYYGFHADC